MLDIKIFVVDRSLLLLLLVVVESTFEIGIVLKVKIEQLTTQKLFPSRKLNVKKKNDVNFIVVPFV